MFGGLREKFRRWQDAGLLTVEQADAILAFERARKSGKLVKDLTNVGIMAIILGLASLVASNWNMIPDMAKLAGHFGICGLIAALMLRIDVERHPVGKDACVLLLFGSFLTFIALVGQIYQLHGDLHTTLAFWLLICTPFVWFYGRTYTVMVPWLMVLLAALYMNVLEYLDPDQGMQIVAATVMAFYLSPVLILASRSFWMARYRPGFVQTFYRLGIILPALFANLALLLFYENFAPYVLHYMLLMALMALGLLAMFIIFRPATRRDETATDLWYYLLVSHIVMMLPFAVPQMESGVLSAVLFVAYWIFIAWLGARMHAAILTDWAIRLVVLRLFIVYLEMFGSMLQTGVGLIVSGILLLVVLRYLNRVVLVGRKLLNYEI